MDITSKSRAKTYHLNADEFRRLMKLPGYGSATIHETLGPYWRHLFKGPHPNGPYYVVRGKLSLKEVLAAVKI